MTNGEIIFRNSIELMKQGVLKPTGRIYTMTLDDGSEIQVPEVEPIHTYNGWKDLGYQVKKGRACESAVHDLEMEGPEGRGDRRGTERKVLDAESVLVHDGTGRKDRLTPADETRAPDLVADARHRRKKG